MFRHAELVDLQRGHQLVNRNLCEHAVHVGNSGDAESFPIEMIDINVTRGFRIKPAVIRQELMPIGTGPAHRIWFFATPPPADRFGFGRAHVGFDAI